MCKKVLLEVLADYGHARWSHWMKWMFENWTEENITRWKKQMVTPYSELSEREKDSDRKEAVRIIEVFNRHTKV